MWSAVSEILRPTHLPGFNSSMSPSPLLLYMHKSIELLLHDLLFLLTSNQTGMSHEVLGQLILLCVHLLTNLLDSSQKMKQQHTRYLKLISKKVFSTLDSTGPPGHICMCVINSSHHTLTNLVTFQTKIKN